MPSSTVLPRKKCYDVIIIGSGIFGLSTAYELIRQTAPRHPLSILILTQSTFHTASWNAAGILSMELGDQNLALNTLKNAFKPSHHENFSPMRTFLLHSLAMVPTWIQTIETASQLSELLQPLDDYHIYPHYFPHKPKTSSRTPFSTSSQSTSSRFEEKWVENPPNSIFKHTSTAGPSPHLSAHKSVNNNHCHTQGATGNGNKSHFATNKTISNNPLENTLGSSKNTISNNLLENTLQSLKNRAQRENLSFGQELTELPSWLANHLAIQEKTAKIIRFSSEWTVPPRKLLTALKKILLADNHVEFCNGTVNNFFLNETYPPTPSTSSPTPPRAGNNYLKAKYSTPNLNRKHIKVHFSPESTPESSTANLTFYTKKLVLTTGSALKQLLNHTPYYNLNSHDIEGTALTFKGPLLEKNAIVSFMRKYYLIHNKANLYFGAANRNLTTGNLTTGNLSTSNLTTKSQSKPIPSQAELFKTLEDTFKTYFKTVSEAPHGKIPTSLEISEFLSGLRGRSFDRMPLLGRINNTKHTSSSISPTEAGPIMPANADPSIYVSALYYKSGFSFAPLASHYLAQLIHHGNDLQTITTPIGKLPRHFFDAFAPIRPKGIHPN